MLMSIFQYLSILFIFVIGLGLGSTITVVDFESAFKKPKAVLIGFFSQYLFMPLCAFAFAKMFGLQDELAVGLILVGASPGGTTSNMFTYWSAGDVALSITMSFLSTVAAFAMMPLWIYILIKVAYEAEVEIAWLNICVSLLLLLIPCILGMSVRYFNTETKLGGKFIWQWIENATTIFGALFLILALVFGIIENEERLFKTAPWSVWIISIIFQPLGCVFGYFVSRDVAKLTNKDSRTICLETGVQNFTLTIAIINLSFKDETTRSDVLIFPITYGFCYIINSVLIVLFLRKFVANFDVEQDDNDEENEDKEEILEMEINEYEQERTNELEQGGG